MTSNSNSSSRAMECSHLPNSILELPCVLCHPALPNTLKMTAKLLATSKAVAAAASSARSSQLQKLQYSMTSSSKAQQVAAWLVKHKDLLQNVSTLQLRLDWTAIESSSRLADLSVWGADQYVNTHVNILPQRNQCNSSSIHPAKPAQRSLQCQLTASR